MVADPPIEVVDTASVSLARERVRAVAAAAGFRRDDVERLALAVSELAQNQLDHARRGRITVGPITRGAVAGVEIVASDAGDGIPDLAGVLDGTVSGKGLGAGLRSVRRLAEELDADVRAGEGTTLRVRRFAGPVARHPEVAVFGRGTGRPSGDHAVVLRDANMLLVAVIDGAGHGAAARETADRAAAEVRADRDPAAIVAAMDEALRGSRGAAASVLRLDLSTGSAAVAGIGNVTARWHDGTRLRSHRPKAGLLGSLRRGAPALEPVVFGRRGLVVMFTDGISSRADVAPVVGRSAIHIAAHVLAGWVKDHDDALVVAVR